MKKVFSLLLCVALTLCLFACGNKLPSLQDGQVLAGFGRIDLSPTGTGFSLVGYGGNGTPDTPKKGMLDPVYGTCIAITDAEGSTALIYTVDTLYTSESEVNKIREVITAKTGSLPTYR